MQPVPEPTRRPEEDLRRSEERFRMLLEAVQDCAIFMLDPRGHVLTWNTGAQRIKGYTAEEVAGRHCSCFYPPEDVARGKPESNLAAAAAAGRFEDEGWRLRKDGSRFWANVVLTALRDSADGRLLGFAKVTRDLSERRRAEEQARELADERAGRAAAEAAGRRATFLAEASQALAASLDYEATLGQVARLAVPHFADWCVVYLVEEGGAVRHLAVAHADPAKERLMRDLHHRYPLAPDFPRGFRRVLRTGVPDLIEEVTDDLMAAAAHNAEHLAQLRGLGLRSNLSVPLVARGRILGAVTFATAESGRRLGPDDLAPAEEFARRAAVALDNARLYHELQEAGRRKDEYLAMLAHELRNPLAPLLTGVHVIRLGQADRAAVERAGQMMERQVRHLTRLVDDLLDVSRISQGKLRLLRERLDLARLVRTAVEDLRPTVQQAGLTLRVEVPETPVWVNGDPTRLAQVVHNLLDNAIKFSDGVGGVAVRVSADPAARQALLVVRDQGVGIEPTMLPRLFGAFAQADHSLQRARGGLGLGLALVRGLVALHGGDVSAASEGPGRGAEFRVRLPLEQEPAALAGAPAEARAAREALRVLVVEDNRDAAESLRMFLALVGHEVRVACTGPEGVGAATAWRPDVVLCDIGLPGLDGYGVAAALRQDPGTARTRLVAVTGYGDDESRRRARASGFDEVLVKPADPQALLGLLAAGQARAE